MSPHQSQTYSGIHIEDGWQLLTVDAGNVRPVDVGTMPPSHSAIAYFANLQPRRVCVFYGNPNRNLDPATVHACAEFLRASTGLLVVYIVADTEGVADISSFPADECNRADAARAVWAFKALAGWDETSPMRIAINTYVVDIYAELPSPQQGWQLTLMWR